MTPLPKHISSLAPLLLVACAGEMPPERGLTATQRSEFVQELAEHQILPVLSELTDSAENLEDETAAFCENEDADGLLSARGGWRKTARAWYSAQLFLFGPAEADPVFPLFSFIDSLRLRGDDYRETVRTHLKSWQEGDDPLDDEFFADLRFTDVGLLAIEMALFDHEKEVSSFSAAPRSCAIVVGLTRQLASRTQELEEAWTEGNGNDAKPYVDLFLSGELPDGKESFTQILVATQRYLEHLHKRSVVTIAGQTSETSWQLLKSALDAIEDLMSEDRGHGSLLDLMNDLGQGELVETLRDDLADVRGAIASGDADELEDALVVLDRDFRRNVPEALGVDVGITLTDGD